MSTEIEDAPAVAAAADSMSEPSEPRDKKDSPFITIPEPLAAFNDHMQLHFEGLSRAIRPALVQIHGETAREQVFNFEQAVIVQCLLQVLMMKGLVTKAELEEVQPAIQKVLSDLRSEHHMGPRTTQNITPEEQPEGLDCRAHHQDCGAACCSSFYVFLTADEVSTGKYLWDVSLPYRLLSDDDGTCVYFDRANFGCSIWKDRPRACRTFDCRSDGRIWEDYPKRTLSLRMLESKARLAAVKQRERAAAAAASDDTRSGS